MSVLDGKVAVVSAAASGIGEAVARRFAQEGAALFCFDINGEQLARVESDLRAMGATVACRAGDGGDSTFVDEAIAAALGAFGSIDVLYNGIGIARPKLIIDTSDADWRAQHAATLDSVFFATRAVLPHMIERKRGSIVSMSAGAGVVGEHSLGAYAAAKAGVINLMECVAAEYGAHGIRANAVTPGQTPTPPQRAWLLTQSGGEAAQSRDAVLRRLSRVEEVAASVLFLASDESANISGICLRGNVRLVGGPK